MAEEHHMNQGPAVSPQGEVMGEQNKGNEPDPVRQDQERPSRGTSKRTESSRRAAGASGQMWDEARESVRTLKQNTDEYVRKNPAKAVFTALAIGFVLGLMRRH